MAGAGSTPLLLDAFYTMLREKLYCPNQLAVLYLYLGSEDVHVVGCSRGTEIQL